MYLRHWQSFHLYSYICTLDKVAASPWSPRRHNIFLIKFGNTGTSVAIPNSVSRSRDPGISDFWIFLSLLAPARGLAETPVQMWRSQCVDTHGATNRSATSEHHSHATGCLRFPSVATVSKLTCIFREHSISKRSFAIPIVTVIVIVITVTSP